MKKQLFVSLLGLILATGMLASDKKKGSYSLKDVVTWAKNDLPAAQEKVYNFIVNFNDFNRSLSDDEKFSIKVEATNKCYTFFSNIQNSPTLQQKTLSEKLLVKALKRTYEASEASLKQPKDKDESKT